MNAEGQKQKFWRKLHINMEEFLKTALIEKSKLQKDTVHLTPRI